MKTQKNPVVIFGLALLLFAGLYLILAGLVTHTWPFASKPTCGNTDGKGKHFTCEGDSKKLNNDVTCATSPCTEKECCTDSGPSPPAPIASCQAIPNRTCDDGVDCSSVTTCQGADAPKMTVDCCEWDNDVIGANGSCVKKAEYKDNDSIACSTNTYDICLINADYCEWQLSSDGSTGIACTVKNNDLAKNLANDTSGKGNCKNCEKMPTSPLCAGEYGLKQKVDCCRKINSDPPTPPPPPPPTPPSAVCQKTTPGGDEWNVIKGCENVNCETLTDCSSGGQGKIQCYKRTSMSTCIQVENPPDACYDEDRNMKNYTKCSVETDVDPCEVDCSATLDCCEPI